MDAVSLFGSANTLYVNEDYEEALKHYTCAVTLQDCAEYRSCRSAAYLKLGKFKEAVEDADEALKFDGKSHMAFHWKGIALFYLGDVAGAKAAFEASLSASPAAKAPRAIWVRKCDAELSGSTLPLGGIAANVSKAVPDAAVAGAPGAPAVTGAAPRPAPVEQKPTEEDAATATKAPPTSEPTVTSKEGLSISGRKQIKREWYQNGTHVFVTIFAKNVPQDACKVDFKERELSLAFPLPGATEEEYQMDIELFDAVEPAQCKYEVSKVKVELSLVKKNAGCQWRDLEKCQEIVYTPDQPAYPTSNKQKRDWSQIDRDIDSELKNEKPAGDEALNKLFKEIYDRADDDTRRAMNKSFQTSGGTVLSTNWGEVARSDYEGKDRPTPPEGQEWRDWKNK
uniref:Uncharacterized protein n=1 Tax=Pyrodinium bahamense TaxID=73915 RepID=A0A7S0F9Y8_9DINO|mmetsp:Transcript_16318/g.44955  ORF Transcript_16318/g.44955 Transcript_16318/m.44955 type:complete len:396 (+) Transcript_16318:77-1264(+)|eukprot:CAMPEP_0179055312 /NCGR_PEP_ID=MMETSP0796-20121207/23235_1 /TAXON_ID=73915 /ORGANISM="Pyrodinium bahamense, Strain pbaha01" /LENGTH=395 /DNA_ID=CAMNT_0020751959 /DNA_START=71 /DNA_END=1258 /DNA_ORIENTATION=+